MTTQMKSGSRQSVKVESTAKESIKFPWQKGTPAPLSEPGVYYHAASPKQRDSILQHGLDYSKGIVPYEQVGIGGGNTPDRKGNYLAGDLDTARGWGAYNHLRGGTDIWRVTPPANHEIRPDIHIDGYREPNAFITPHPIPPHHLELVEHWPEEELQKTKIRTLDPSYGPDREVYQITNDWSKGTPRSSRISNILDPIHDELDQRVYKGTRPRPSKIKFIKDHFMETIKEIVPIPEPYFDLYLTGSLTTYQYSDNSDCDISVFPKYEELMGIMGLPDANQVRRILVAYIIDKIDGLILPGTQHPVQHFVVQDGVSLNQMYHQGLRSAWSFQDEDWVVEPEIDRAHDISIELPLLFLRARAIADKMRIALDTDPETAKRLFKRIHKKRSADQARGLGDFSESNIIYKYLLNQGLFDRLKEIGVYIAKTSATQRLFIAFELPEDATQQIVSWMADNAPEGVHPQPPENLHQTLAFLGDTDETSIPELAAVIAKYDPSTVTITGPTEYRELDRLGMLVFQDQGGQELWAALNAELKALNGYEPQFSPWLSHSTTWYFKDKPNLQPTYLPEMTFQPVGIHIMKSERLPEGGARYVKVAAFDIDDPEAIEWVESMLERGERMGWTPEETKQRLINMWDTPPPDVDEIFALGQAKWEETKRLRAENAAEIKRLMDARPKVVYNIRWGWYNGNVILSDATDWPGDKVHAQILEELGVPEEALFVEDARGDLVDLQQTDAEGVFLGYATVLDNGEIDTTPESYDYGDKDSIPAVVRQQVEDEIRAQFPIAKTADSKEPMQVIYDFSKDRIILGSKSEAANLPHTIIIGHYSQNHVTLYQTAHQWLNTAYFKRLWNHSFPTYPLTGVSLQDHLGPKRIAALKSSDITYLEAFMYVGEPYNQLLITGDTMHYKLIERFMRDHDIEDERLLEQFPFVLGHIGYIAGETDDNGLPQSKIPKWLAGLPHVIVFDSHSSGYLQTDPAVKDKALAAIRQFHYPNTTDITDRVLNNWWKGGAREEKPVDWIYNGPNKEDASGQQQLPLDWTDYSEEPLAPEEPERKPILYLRAFVYLGPPENQLLLQEGINEHSELAGDWIEEKTIEYLDNGYDPDEASEAAYSRFDNLPSAMGHIGAEHMEDGSRQVWVVFYSGYKDLRRQQPMRHDALDAIRLIWPNAKEGDDWVYSEEKNKGWYGYGN